MRSSAGASLRCRGARANRAFPRRSGRTRIDTTPLHNVRTYRRVGTGIALSGHEARGRPVARRSTANGPSLRCHPQLVRRTGAEWGRRPFERMTLAGSLHHHSTGQWGPARRVSAETSRWATPARPLRDRLQPVAGWLVGFGDRARDPPVRAGRVPARSRRWGARSAPLSHGHCNALHDTSPGARTSSHRGHQRGRRKAFAGLVLPYWCRPAS